MIKSVPQSPVSVASVASSETSETPSVSDELIMQPVGSVGSTVKQVKPAVRKKVDLEKEKPPWRPSSGLVPKADKNALLKARLLDASRRTLRLRNTVSSQTDPISTKLMKEAAIDVQSDLTQTCDAEVLTDGDITIHKQQAGGFILTNSVAQMTEGITSRNMATQTALPRINLAIDKPLRNRGETFDEAQHMPHSLDEEILANEQKLIKQMNEIRMLDNKLKYTMDQNESDNLEEHLSDENDSLHSNDSLSEKRRDASDLANLYKIGLVRPRSFLEAPTLTSWENDFSDNEDELPELPRRTYSVGEAPWKNFRDVVIGRRLANMHLSPILPRNVSSSKKKTVSWSDSQKKAVSELISEASALVDVFDRVSLLLGPDIKLKSDTDAISKMDVTPIPPSKWEEDFTRSCGLLEDKIKNLQPVRVLKPSKPLSVDLLH